MIIKDDEFLTLEQQKKFKESILTNSLWHFQPQTNIDRPGRESLRNDEQFQFVNWISEDNINIGPCKAIFFSFLNKHKIQLNKIIRIKSNITTNNNNTNYLAPHIDLDYDHKVFLYYVNDSDGDTIFFEQFWHNGIQIEEKDLTESIRITPKMGRGVVFDGLQYHASSNPTTNNYRCVININFT
jgi:hypothetical protein